MPIKKKAPAKKAAPLGPKAKLMKLTIPALRKKAKALNVSDYTKRTKENLVQSIILGEARKNIGKVAKKKTAPKTSTASRQTKMRERDIVKDLLRKAKAPGKRRSASGKIYYERRANRSDVPGTFLGSNKHMGAVYTNDLSMMGKSEIFNLMDLLKQYVDQNTTPVYDALWNDDGVGFGYNSISGNVWLQNEDYTTAMVNYDGKLDIFLVTPYYGHEGFLFELAPEKDTATWNDEDIQYLYDVYSELPNSAYKRKLSRYFE